VLLEAADKYVRVLTRDDEALVRMPLKELLERLPPTSSGRCTAAPSCGCARSRARPRGATGRLTLHLRSRPERIEVSRAFAHLFRAD
jgi:hypothetical protein